MFDELISHEIICCTLVFLPRCHIMYSRKVKLCYGKYAYITVIICSFYTSFNADMSRGILNKFYFHVNI